MYTTLSVSAPLRAKGAISHVLPLKAPATRAETKATAPCGRAPGAGDVLAEIAAFGSACRFRKGQTILCDGEAAEHCFQVVRGMVRLYKLLPDGRRQIVDFIFPGEFFGLTVDDAYDYSADAVTDTTLLSYSSRVLARLARERQAVAQSLQATTYRELSAAQAHIVLLGRKTAFERVASFLLGLSRRATVAGNDGVVVWVPMSQADIADYLGLTTETVNRVVAQLRESGVVTVPSRGVMRLESPAELEGMACAA